jgi:hypothetical protein
MRIAIDGELRPKIVVHYVKEIVSWVEFEIGWCAATETREEELERKRERRRSGEMRMKSLEHLPNQVTHTSFQV